MTLILESDDEDFSRQPTRETGGAKVTRGRPIASLHLFVLGVRSIAREQARKRRTGNPQPKSWRPRRPGGAVGWTQ